jgi:TctA family transporter
VLILIGFYLLCRTFVPDSRCFVPIVSLVLSTFLWTREFLIWSGFYQFDTIGYVLSYPSTFAFDVSCILVYVAYSRRAEPTVGQALVIGVGTSIVILTHPLTALFLLTALGTIYFEENWQHELTNAL